MAAELARKREAEARQLAMDEANDAAMLNSHAAVRRMILTHLSKTRWPSNDKIADRLRAEPYQPREEDDPAPSSRSSLVVVIIVGTERAEGNFSSRAEADCR